MPGCVCVCGVGWSLGWSSRGATCVCVCVAFATSFFEATVGITLRNARNHPHPLSVSPRFRPKQVRAEMARLRPLCANMPVVCAIAEVCKGVGCVLAREAALPQAFVHVSAFAGIAGMLSTNILALRLLSVRSSTAALSQASDQPKP